MMPKDQALAPPHATTSPDLPDSVLAVGLRNNQKRFFIPSSENFFAGIRYEYVLVDNGCNTLLLPFPSDITDLFKFMNDSYCWHIGWTGGVGNLQSPTLLIDCPFQDDEEDVGELYLAGRFVVKVKSLRFHLGKKAAQQLLEAVELKDTYKKKLETFLADLGEREAEERKYVLLGQSVLSQLVSLQSGKLLLLCKRKYFPTREDFCSAWKLILEIELPEHFHDLDDIDHGGEGTVGFEHETWCDDPFID